MPKFEWDDNKNELNQEKHKLPFEDAIDVFNDEDRINYESDRGGEKRYRTLGKAFKVIVIVIYATRNLVVRIISARRAGKEERRVYLSKKLSKQDDDTE